MRVAEQIQKHKKKVNFRISVVTVGCCETCKNSSKEEGSKLFCSLSSEFYFKTMSFFVCDQYEQR